MPPALTHTFEPFDGVTVASDTLLLDDQDSASLKLAM